MKKFLIKAAAFFLILALIFVPFAVIIDPYNIFHADKIVENGCEPNKNYVKMRNVLKHPDRYDSFLFGSSRVGFIDVSRINDGTYYDMMYSEGLPAEHLENLKVMIDHGIIPKNVLLGVDDISYFVDPKLHDNQLYRLNYPWEGSWEDKAGFYLRYFDLITLSESLHVLNTHAKDDPDYGKRLLDTGTENLAIVPQFNYEGAKAWWSSYYYPREEGLQEIREIKELCDEYGIKLRVFTNPLNALTYTKDIDNGYLVFLDELADVTDYWNFSGYNSVTLDYDNYYETSHYCAAVGDKIIDTIYYDKTDPELLDQGFGMYVTEDNKDELISMLKLQAVNYDLPVNTYSDTINAAGNSGNDDKKTEESDESTGDAEETSSESTGMLQEKADGILTEKLRKSGKRAVFEEEITVNNERYYMYKAVSSEGDEYRQKYVVNALTGEVGTYDPEKKSISSFDDFNYSDMSEDH